MSTEKKSNRLINEKSPYLLQHAHNPVDWFPWGEEAFAKAKAEDKPVFLSIGYSTCHWCHVMEKESFEDDEVATLLNEDYISIKVDREERPEIDAIYMTVCQMLTGGGGWPLTIIMTPEKLPFFAGTYFPRETRGNRPGLTDILPRITELWVKQREDILNSAKEITEHLSKVSPAGDGQKVTIDLCNAAFAQFQERFDKDFGGFSNAPKFPTPHNMIFLLRYYHRTKNREALDMVTKTLIEMRKGGIYDHLGYGFHRYSTDKEWLVPHFEKMLYDQALLAYAYAEAYHVTHFALFRQTTEEIFNYVDHVLTSPEGAFYSAEDADSEGEEGKFYMWSAHEVKSLLGSNAGAFSLLYNIEDNGNFADPLAGESTGDNIIHIKRELSEIAQEIGIEEDALSEKMKEAREILFHQREKRIRPSKDDKILSDWNGLMIAAYASAGKIFNDPGYIKKAERAADFLINTMITPEDRIMHRYRDGDVSHDGCIEDYAFVIWGLIELYEASFNPKYLEKALKLTETVLEHFTDTTGGFYFTADFAESLIIRQKEVYDGAIPSGNSVMLTNLKKLYRLTGDGGYEQEATIVSRAFSHIVKNSPSAFAYFMCGIEMMQDNGIEIVIAANSANPNLKRYMRELISTYNPNKVILYKDTSIANNPICNIALFTTDMNDIEGEPIFYLCHNSECELPTASIDEVLAKIE